MSRDIKFSLNTTEAYHTDQLNTLGWELTMCNALYPKGTPLRRILARDHSYGHLLHEYLGRFIPIKNIKKILEIGGGYGYLMKDFLDYNDAAAFETSMLDISPVLLEKQKEILKGFPVVFRNENFLETNGAYLSEFDLVILNENLGDFPTLVNVSRELLQMHGEADDPSLQKMFYFFRKYDLDRTLPEIFHFNLGALQVLEKLCVSGVPYIFLGEHSCEAALPAIPRLHACALSTGMPERISLKGHDEYTIKFSYLQKVAETFGYEYLRGPFADFVPLAITEELRFTLASHGCGRDDGEMICQFVEDLFKYEYLILIRK